MIIVLTEGFDLTNDKGQKAFSVDPGSRLSTIRFEYLPVGAKILTPWAGSKGTPFYVYVYGCFIAIAPEKCEIPVTTTPDGWSLNI